MSSPSFGAFTLTALGTNTDICNGSRFCSEVEVCKFLRSVHYS
jgi:hypothetical protein